MPRTITFYYWYITFLTLVFFSRMYSLSQNAPYYFLNNSVKNQPIIILVSSILRKLDIGKIVPTSPTNCCYTTWKSAARLILKKITSIVFIMSQE